MKQEQEKTIETKDRHPMITLGILTAGTQVGSALIQRMGRHPVLLFAMGVTAGVYTYRNRNEILAEAQHLKVKSQKILSKDKSDLK